MSRIFVAGTGAVSPAGWGMGPLRNALQTGTPLPIQPLDRPGSSPLRGRPVPAPATRPAFLAHPRLRRASPITHYAAAAALEAMAPLLARPAGIRRVGIVACLDAGCVQYSCRFFEETLKDPATASPLLFPETVFSAIASNVSSLLEQPPSLHTLIGDSATFLQGLALAADWLVESRVDACLVIGTGELNWLLADALWHLDHSAVLTAGAGAIALVCDESLSSGTELKAITSSHTYTSRVSRHNAASRMRQQLPAPGPGDLLCDSLGDNSRTNRAELDAWSDWTGPRLSPRRILGEGLVAATGWQCAAAVDLLNRGTHTGANVSVAGTNQQAIGARFARHEFPQPGPILPHP